MSLNRIKYNFHPSQLFTKSMLVGLILVSLFIGGCDEEVSVFEQKVASPIVSSFTPSTGAVGTDLTINGDFLTDVDTVKIGGVLAQIKSRVSKNQLVVNVLPECKSGVVSVHNSTGWIASSESFTMEYIIPTLASFSSTAKVNDVMEIRGTKMYGVFKVYLRQNDGVDVEAKILNRREDELFVEVPYFMGANAKVVLTYLTQSSSQNVISADDFSLTKPTPLVTNKPVEGQVKTTVELAGENLSVIDKVMVGEFQAQIVSRDSQAISFIVPGQFEGSTFHALKLIYYGDQEIAVNTKFRVIRKVEKVYFWEDRTIQCQVDDATDAFFNPKIGYAYSPCEYEANRNDIYFYVVWSGSSSLIQLNNPNNSSSQAKNFKCEGEDLPFEKLPNVVKFRILSATDSTQLALKNKVINKEIVEITDETWAGVPKCASNTPRFFPSATEPQANQFVVGDVLMFQRFDAGEPFETGFIYITNLTIPDFTEDADEGKKAVITFNCYFQK